MNSNQDWLSLLPGREHADMLSNWVNMGGNMLACSLFDGIWEGTYWHAHSLMESNLNVFLL